MMNRKDIARPFDNGALTQSNAGFNPLAAINDRAAEKVANILGQMQIAKAFPRNMYAVQQKTESEFSRPSLAEKAVYAYPKGGTTVTGPSIRAAESIARCMGNIRYGFEELEVNLNQHYTRVRAYAVDMENNIPAERVFTVEHKRTAKGKTTIITEPRELYELVANQSQRRVRACILQLVPADLIDFAMQTCADTMQSNINLGDPHVIEALLTAFKAFDVNQTMIEKRIGRNISAILPNQYVDLRNVYASLRDNVAKVEDFFDITVSDAAQAAQQAQAKLEQQNAPAEKAKPAQPSNDAVVIDTNIMQEDEQSVTDDDMDELTAMFEAGSDSPF